MRGSYRSTRPSTGRCSCSASSISRISSTRLSRRSGTRPAPLWRAVAGAAAHRDQAGCAAPGVRTATTTKPTSTSRRTMSWKTCGLPGGRLRPEMAPRQRLRRTSWPATTQAPAKTAWSQRQLAAPWASGWAACSAPTPMTTTRRSAARATGDRVAPARRTQRPTTQQTPRRAFGSPPAWRPRPRSPVAVRRVRPRAPRPS
mmetsp:Transcript_123321/g.356380  ORF Transcript_123321/g.356380 Transcript_123321/m.356380 type:complete len:201 (+) Transcript_123321:1830-2432(+)